MHICRLFHRKNIPVYGATVQRIAPRFMKTDNQTVQFVVVSGDEAGQRIDNFLLARLKGVPKSMIYRIIRKGEVRIRMLLSN